MVARTGALSIWCAAGGGWRLFLADDSGAVSIEYAVIAAFLSIAIVSVVFELGIEVDSLFASIRSGF